MRISKFTRAAVASAVCSGALLTVSMPTQANKALDETVERRHQLGHADQRLQCHAISAT